jgi:perosamine synthetase
MTNGDSREKTVKRAGAHRSGVAMSARPRIAVAAPVIGDREIAYVTDAVRSGWVSSIGVYVERFEREFAEFVGALHGVAVANGTVALHLALHSLGIGHGDEVIVPDLTFAATAHAVLMTGATPVFADVEPDTWCLDPRALDRAIGPRTRAIVPVHLYGHPADLPAIAALARPRGIVVLEDAAQAHGARIGGARVGAIGDVGSFSFYGNKLITTGEGGMLTTDDDALAARMRFLKDQGIAPQRHYFHEELAFNYAMTNLQAALGVAQLERIDCLVAKKRQIFGWYAERLAGRVCLNAERAGCTAVYWMVCAVLGGDPGRRERIRACLAEAGVETRPFFVPMSRLPHLASYRAVGVDREGCPVAADLSVRGFNLPSGCGLERADVDFVCDALLRML